MTSRRHWQQQRRIAPSAGTMPPPITPEEGVGVMQNASAEIQTYSAPQPARMPSNRSTSAAVTPSNGSRMGSRRASPSPNASPVSTTSTASSCHGHALMPIDYQALDYVGEVNESLNCPICRMPLYRPLTINGCGHTFCTRCLRRSYEIQPICPIDREHFRHPHDVFSARVIGDMVDRLTVKCPNTGCAQTMFREDLKTHYERDCEHTLVSCPESRCGGRVPRLDATEAKGCLHRPTSCQYCRQEMLVAELDHHYDTGCRNHTTTCQLCKATVVRHRLPRHAAHDCPETEMRCKWASLGCPFKDARRDVQKHETGQRCVYETIAKLQQLSREDRLLVNDLKGEVASLKTQIRRQERASSPPHPIDTASFLTDLNLKTNQPSSRDSPRSINNTLAPGSSFAATHWADVVVNNGPEDYVLAQWQRMETEFEDLRKALTDQDGRHSMLLLNETIPIKEQLTELRSQIGVIGMHCTWMMNMFRQARECGSNGGSRSAATVDTSSAGVQQTSSNSSSQAARHQVAQAQEAGGGNYSEAARSSRRNSSGDTPHL